MFQRLIILCVLVSGCSSSTSQLKTWILPTVETHPEETKVHDSYPVEPVVIEKLF